MRFEVLGSLEVKRDGSGIAVRGRKTRLLLAALLSRAGRTVSQDVLIETLWNGDPPAGALNTLRWHVHRLRGLLSDPERISFDADGYRIHIGPDELDSRLFETWCAQARAKPDTEAAELYGRALGLWRGRAYEEFDGGGPIREAANRLEQQRVDAWERHIERELALGRHDGLVANLSILVNEYPFREAFCAQLMLALYRSGRQADALAAFQDARSRLVDNLGLEPGPRLRELEMAILNSDPVLDTATTTAAVPPSIPAELPAEPSAFTGRETELSTLVESVVAESEGPRLVSISGMGGMGKSALAVRLAHRVKDRFPDGQLYVNLHGATPDVKPIEPAEALGRFLRALGVAGAERLTDTEELAGRFRTATADRRLLLVLDDAGSAEQIRPLLPAGSGCAVVITSRPLLPSVDSQCQVPLDGLSVDDSLTLLRRLLPEGRTNGQEAALNRLIELCSGLPLALKICAARLAARPKWSVSVLVDRLTDERGRLAELVMDDLAVRAGFAVSYRELRNDPDGFRAARLFRLLALHEGPDITVPVAGALAGLDQSTTEDLLDVLCRTQLVEEHELGRYRSHDLLRCYARELVDDEEPEPARLEAYGRMLYQYCATARACCRLVFPALKAPYTIGPALTDHPVPSLTDESQALDWLRAELTNITAACAAGPGTADLPATAVSIGQALVPMTDVHLSPADALRLAEAVVAVTERGRDIESRFTAYATAGTCMEHLDRPIMARTYLQLAIEMRESADSPARLSGVFSTMAEVHRQLDDQAEALRFGNQSLAAGRAEGSRINEARALLILGKIHADAGDYEAAVAAQEHSIEISKSIGHALNRVTAMGRVADVYIRQSRYREAIAQLRDTIALSQQHGLDDSGVHAVFLWSLAEARYACRDHAVARQIWDRSAAILRERGMITEAEQYDVATTTPPKHLAILD